MSAVCDSEYPQTYLCQWMGLLASCHALILKVILCVCVCVCVCVCLTMIQPVCLFVFTLNNCTVSVYISVCSYTDTASVCILVYALTPIQPVCMFVFTLNNCIVSVYISVCSYTDTASVYISVCTYTGTASVYISVCTCTDTASVYISICTYTGTVSVYICVCTYTDTAFVYMCSVWCALCAPCSTQGTSFPNVVRGLISQKKSTDIDVSMLVSDGHVDVEDLLCSEIIYIPDNKNPT